MPDFDRRKSLQQLDGQDWGEPTYPTHLVRECHRLRRVPLRDFTAENLRIMIGQNIGLQYLVPLALELLCVDPFTEGDFYQGDLLQNVLRVEASFWQRRPDLRKETADVAAQAFSLLPTLDEIDRQCADQVLHEAYATFQKAEES
jgi:CDI immunity proteins